MEAVTGFEPDTPSHAKAEAARWSLASNVLIDVRPLTKQQQTFGAPWSRVDELRKSRLKVSPSVYPCREGCSLCFAASSVIISCYFLWLP